MGLGGGGKEKKTSKKIPKMDYITQVWGLDLERGKKKWLGGGGAPREVGQKKRGN